MTTLTRPPRSAPAPPPDARTAPRPRAGTVLIVSHAFPPTGGPGVQRSSKFAKYLPQFGWTPIIAAARPLPELPQDASLEADLPSGVRVHRSAHLDPAAWQPAKRTAGEGFLTGVAWRFARLNRAFRYAMLPDPAIGWALANVLPCLRLIGEHRVDVIYSTYSPASNHLLAWCLHAMTGIRWVADFRDLWTDDYNYPHRNTWRAGIDRRLESAWIRAADRVIGVTDGQVEILRRHAPDQPGKFRTITNGVDLDDFASLVEPESSRDHEVGRSGDASLSRASSSPRVSSPSHAEAFTLTFAGWFLSDRVPEALIDALAEFDAWVSRRSGRWCLRVVGTIGEEMRLRIASRGIPLEAPGYVPHSDAVGHMVAADVLLLLIPGGRNGRTLMTGKVYEYLAARRPILVVSGSRGAEAECLIRRHDAGTVVPDEVASIVAALRDFWQRWQAGDLDCTHTHADLDNISRRYTAGQLAAVLDSTMTGSQAASAAR